jgi:hypothetical protein
MADQSKKPPASNSAKPAALDYEAEMAATRAKMEKLRALRLARDAALPPKPAKAAPKRKAAAAKPEKRPAGNLSQWLDDQQKSGRNS